MEKGSFFTGIDVGSTTAKLAVFDGSGLPVHGDYRRHNALVAETLLSMLEELEGRLGACELALTFTGSAGIGLAERTGLPFVQEVIAASEYLKRSCPEVRTYIEIGGEDAKVVFFDGGLPDIRMNGSCAGGTGAFIEQMADLLEVSLAEFDKLAGRGAVLYSVASRCGVFAKTDVQSLLSNGAAKADIAASVFHALALQVVASLARGSLVRRKVLFAGGPLTFFPRLRHAFMKVLDLVPERDTASLPRMELVAASGAALLHRECPITVSVAELAALLKRERERSAALPGRLPVLFRDAAQREAWGKRHDGCRLPERSISSLNGDPCFLGIDSGSTTTKMVLIDGERRVIMSSYGPNGGDPIDAVRRAMASFRENSRRAGRRPRIVRSAVTGYGEQLIMAAFGIDDGIVETTAHLQAALSLVPSASFILDMGGQDMKAIYVRDGLPAEVQLNEACSSGCGSFIETFAHSLHYSVDAFADLACGRSLPFDLGTRCTVFMNSRVRQALKEGATVADVSAGLAYSVVKNALYKVLKLTNPDVLGKNIVVQGGTFRNDAVLRAFELLMGREAKRPAASEIMGAYGAALTARDNYLRRGRPVSLFKGLERAVSVSGGRPRSLSCRGCGNRCPVLKTAFTGGRSYFSGNRCERYFANAAVPTPPGENMAARKLELIFNRPMKPEGPPRLVFGLPRVLNMFENFPFWCAFLTHCGFEVALSAPSDVRLFEKGLGAVMSDNICFPAKLAQGHVLDLAQRGVDRIFYPIVVYEGREYEDALNSYNCPVVTGYPDVVGSSVDPEKACGVPLDKPVVGFRDQGLLEKQLIGFMRRFGVRKGKVRLAVREAADAQRAYRADLRELAAAIMKRADEDGRPVVVLAGRPYHADPLINHGIPEILSGLGVHVVTEDFAPLGDGALQDCGILTQWACANRIVAVARFAASGKLAGMVQTTSFGCGLDALTADEAREIMTNAGRPYALLKMDEIADPGAVRVRLRALVESLRNSPQRAGERAFPDEVKRPSPGGVPEKTIIAPWFSPYYSPFIPAVFEHFGYPFLLLPPQDRPSLETGLKYVNNDMCYPAVLVIGDVLHALESKKYDPGNTAVLFTQTFGQCRASSYLPLLRKALDASGFGDVALFSAAAGDRGLDLPLRRHKRELVERLAMGLIFGDVLNEMFLAAAPRETRRGQAAALRDAVQAEMLRSLGRGDFPLLLALLEEAVDAFNKIPAGDAPVPVVGLLGEIFVKYNTFSNQDMVAWLMGQGVEVVLPPLVNFFTQRFLNEAFNRRCRIKKSPLRARAATVFLDAYVSHHLGRVEGVMRRFRRRRKAGDLRALSSLAASVTSLANQAGEGWLLTAEMIAMLQKGVSNIVCLQPFGCLANHVTGKGVERRLRGLYPSLNILFIDMDAGASEVNVLNRLHFMIAAARSGNSPMGSVLPAALPGRTSLPLFQHPQFGVRMAKPLGDGKGHAGENLNA